MDEFIKKRLGILILSIMGLFAIPFAEWLGTLGLTVYWLVFILGVYGVSALFCEEVVRHYFKITKTETPPDQ